MSALFFCLGKTLEMISQGYGFDEIAAIFQGPNESTPEPPVSNTHLTKLIKQHSIDSNMNLDNNPTIRELKQLIARQEDDKYGHILYVTTDGDVNFARVHPDLVPGDLDVQNRKSYQFRLESFDQGNGYVGPDAAEDDAWMQRLMQALLDNWHEKNVGYIDIF